MFVLTRNRMLLRLRQLTSSLLMLQLVLQDLAEREDLEKIKEIVKEAKYNENTGEGQLIIKLREQLEGWKDVRHDQSTQNTAGSSSTIQGPLANTGGTFGKEFNFKPYLKSLTVGENWDQLRQKSKCSMCNGHPAQGGATWLTICGHLTCSHCYASLTEQAHETGDDDAQMQCKATNCKQWFKEFTVVPPEEVPMYTAPETRSKTASQSQYQKAQKIENQDIKEDWMVLGSEGVLPSAKTIAVKAQILNWIQENPNVKIIIYTQFLAMIRILNKMCQEEGWVTEQYHGKMSFGSRDNAIKHFADNPNAKVLLASLRCGGLGLNLTMASKVMILDP